MRIIHCDICGRDITDYTHYELSIDRYYECGNTDIYTSPDINLIDHPVRVYRLEMCESCKTYIKKILEELQENNNG